MKRARENEGVYLYTRSKYPKQFYTYSPPPRNSFIFSATDIKNYILKDSLVDWLKLTLIPKQAQHNDPFLSFILQRGKDFETEIVKLMNTKYPVVSISEKITPKTCKKTIDLMRIGTPLIHSAPFKNGKLKIKGIIDFLIRSDYMHLFTGENPLPENLRSHKASKLNGNYHYIVLDIKFSTLPLRADGIHLLNSGNYPFYKSQLFIYTKGIGDIQGYTSNYAYILGRRWRQTYKGDLYNSLDCMDRIGQIDYNTVDNEYVDRTNMALNWLKELKKYGKTWTINPPTRSELYPNMCKDSGMWNKEKEQIANNLGDITQIWYCGVKNREKAFDKGIRSWRDKRCNSQNIGMNGKRGVIIDEIIKINRDEGKIISPQKIKNNMFNWKIPCNEVFVDFESFADIFSSFEDLPLQVKSDRIFMIGVYYKSFNKWTYTSFIMERDTDKAEIEMMVYFCNFMKTLGYPKMWYWHAESGLWNRAEARLEKNMDPNILAELSETLELTNWADMSKIFKDEPIVIKGCFKFGLKEVSKALFNHNLITTEMNSECKSGLDASLSAWKVYKEYENGLGEVQHHPQMLDIQTYNKYDVQVLEDILRCIRRYK